MFDEFFSPHCSPLPPLISSDATTRFELFTLIDFISLFISISLSFRIDTMSFQMRIHDSHFRRCFRFRCLLHAASLISFSPDAAATIFTPIMPPLSP